MKHSKTILMMAAVFFCRAAEACNGCRQAVGGDGASGSFKVNGEALGYAVSIGMMLCMVAGILGGLGFMAYRNCRAIAMAQSAALATEGQA